MKNLRILPFPGLLVSILLIINTTAFATGGTMSGSGTAGSPYLVKDYADLKAIGTGSYALSAIYRLANDIDASASKTENGGSGFVPIGSEVSNFTGKFHGAGHAIKNLTIQRPAANCIGLFAYISLATIDSLGVTKSKINGNYYVGCIVGFNKGRISNCNASGNVTGVTVVGGIAGENEDTINNCSASSSCFASGERLSGSIVGGIAGRCAYGAIRNCHSTGDVRGDIVEVGGIVGQIESSIVSYCYSTGNVTGGSEVGGIVGLNQEGTISICCATGNVSGIYGSIGGIVGSNGAGYSGPGKTINCYSTGNVTGTDDAGGVAGTNNDTISFCYATGKVTGSYIGGVVGNNYDATVIQCNWNKETTGLISGYGDDHSTFTGSGFTTAQMQKASNFTGWDFNKVWIIRTDSTYPCLRGIENAPFALPDFMKSNRTFTLSRLLLNDYDIQSGHKNLVLKIIRVSEGTTDSVSKLTFPSNVSNGNVDTLYYRVGKALVADTLWGNTAKSVITLDETFTSVALYPEKSESLLQNYPNPFTSTTTIKYKVTVPGFVSLMVFDVMGTEVATLVNEQKPAGDYSIDWNASGLAGGTYFCRLQAGLIPETRKLILHK
jgi:hypothetical protein